MAPPLRPTDRGRDGRGADEIWNAYRRTRHTWGPETAPLAAGLPVVATRVPDVVSDFGEMVDLQDDGAGFADACRRVERHCPLTRAAKAEPLLHWHHWDTIAAQMERLIVRGAESEDSGAEGIA